MISCGITFQIVNRALILLVLLILSKFTSVFSFDSEFTKLHTSNCGCKIVLRGISSCE